MAVACRCGGILCTQYTVLVEMGAWCAFGGCERIIGMSQVESKPELYIDINCLVCYSKWRQLTPRILLIDMW